MQSTSLPAVCLHIAHVLAQIVLGCLIFLYFTLAMYLKDDFKPRTLVFTSGSDNHYLARRLHLPQNGQNINFMTIADSNYF